MVIAAPDESESPTSRHPFAHHSSGTESVAKGMTMMADPKDYVVSEAASITDVDLDREKINLRGEQLTEDHAERIAETVLQETRRRGLIPWRK